MKAFILTFFLVAVGCGTAFADIPKAKIKYTIVGTCICIQQLDEYLTSVFPTTSHIDTDVNCVTEVEKNASACEVFREAVEANAKVDCIEQKDAKLDICNTEIITNE